MNDYTHATELTTFRVKITIMFLQCTHEGAVQFPDMHLSHEFLGVFTGLEIHVFVTLYVSKRLQCFRVGAILYIKYIGHIITIMIT